MAKTIDSKVVSMQFENASFERGVQQSLRTIDDLKKGLQFKDANKGFEGISTAAKGINLSSIADALDVVKDRFSLMGLIGMSVINNLTNRVMQFGEQLVRSFVIDPIKTGLQEYETQINAIQTILANTASKGTTMDDVTAALRELNTYADMTIYNFTEMTKNIGTFTAAGVDLDTSVEAIKGIANLAAVSGSNSQQAATAMYQLSQALSSGTVKLMDWNSVVNAGMGGQVFQDALKETARLHGIAIDQMIEDEGSFRETLKSGWLTSTVLTETLAKFTGDLTAAELAEKGYTEEQIKKIQELGTMANDAATKVKTLTQLNDTLKEAAQSGWTQTWELIIGDFEEAKAFFTELSDYFGGLIGQSADARNAVVSAWKDLGGRESMLNSIRNILAGILEVTKPIGEALREIFPPVTGIQLYNLTRGLEVLTEKFKMVGKYGEDIKRLFKGVFALLDIGRMLFVALGESIFGLFVTLKPTALTLTDLLLKFADFVVQLRDSIKATDAFRVGIARMLVYIKPYVDTIKEFFMNLINGIKGINFKTTRFSGIFEFLDGLTFRFQPLTKLKDLLLKFLTVVGKLISVAAPIFVKLGTVIGDGLSWFLDKVSTGLDNFDPEKIFTIIHGGLFAGILLAIKKFVSEGTGLFGGVGDILDTVKGSLEAWQSSLKADILLKIAFALGILTLSVIGLSLVNPENLAAALGAMTVMFVQLGVSMSVLGKILTNPLATASMAVGLISISSAILLLSVAVYKLSSLNPRQLTRGVIALGVVIAILKKTAIELSTVSGRVITGAIGIGILSVALVILATAVKKLGSIQTGVLTQGLIGLGLLLTEIGIFLKVVGGTPSIIAASTGLIILSGALIILSGAIVILGSINTGTLIQGLLGIATALTIVAIAMSVMPTDMIFTGVGLLVVSAALIVLATALKTMGSMSWDEIGRGLTVLTGTLLILYAALSAMTGTIVGSASLVIAAGAIAILAVALTQLGKMTLEEIGLSILALASALTIIGIAGAVLTPVIPSLLGLAVALALIGVAALATGVGILALSIGLTALAAAGAAGAVALVVLITSIVSLIPMIAKQLGVGLITIITTLAEGAPLLLEGIVTLLNMLIDGLILVIPKLVDAILLFVTTILEELAASLPAILQAGYDILIALLEGVKNNIGEITELGYEIMIEFMNAIAKKIPDLIKAGFNLIISFIDGLAVAVEQNIPRLMSSVQNLGLSIVRGVIKGLFNARGELIAAVKDLANSILAEFGAILGIHSPSIEMFEQAKFIISGLVNGLYIYGKDITDATEQLANNAISEFKSLPEKLQDIMGTSLDIDPTIRPVIDLTNIEQAGKGIAHLLAPKPLNLALAVASSSGISQRMGMAGQPSSTSGESQTGTINFTQNNYSPKELSRIEIYRQTKIQLLQAKGLAGVK